MSPEVKMPKTCEFNNKELSVVFLMSERALELVSKKTQKEIILCACCLLIPEADNLCEVLCLYLRQNSNCIEQKLPEF